MFFYVLFARFEEFNSLLTNCECNIFLFGLSSRIAPTSVVEANTFDVEDGDSPQHPRGERANGAGDPTDHHEQLGSLDPCGQHVSGGKPHQHGTRGLQRSGFQQPRGRLVVGNANRDVDV